MKTLLVISSLALAGVSTVHAQTYRSATGPGAAVGAVAGALIGGHNHDNWAGGAILGGVAGALVGAAIDSSQPAEVQQPVYATTQAPVVYSQQGVVQPTVPNAPVVASTQPQVVTTAQPQVVYTQPQVVYTQPQVVYAQPAPQVVYVQPAAPVYYAPRYYAPYPAVSLRLGYYSGPGYYRGGYYGGGHYHGHR